MNRVFLLSVVFFLSILFASGGYDNGKAAGKGNLDISLTWNPFNYFNKGQSYVIFGYGLTNRLDIHGYYSQTQEESDNYYGGIFYQFYKSKRINLSTAIGYRKYNNQNTVHAFFPQLIYDIHFSKKVNIGGSIVSVRKQDLKSELGVAQDIFIMSKIFENSNYKVSFSFGVFNPAIWKPDKGDWHPTYSVDIKIKN